MRKNNSAVNKLKNNSNQQYLNPGYSFSNQCPSNRHLSIVALANNLSRHHSDDENDSEDSKPLSTTSQGWQASTTSIKERIAFMFNNEFLADVHFIVGKGNSVQRIPAHKFVLSVSSSVFDRMFNGILTSKSDEIELPDVEPAAFFALLR